MNKTVLVTGASRGIGRALVAALLGRGAARVYAARDVSDPMSREVSDAWHSSPIKELERQFAAFAERASNVSIPVEVSP